MKTNNFKERGRLFAAKMLLAVAPMAAWLYVPAAQAQESPISLIPGNVFIPGNLAVTRSVYTDGKNITAGVTNLPPGCTPVTAGNPTPADPCITAVTSSASPLVFNNDTDGSFGVTSKIYIDQITPFGFVLTSL